MKKHRTLEEIRNDIDRVDGVIREAFLERMNLASEIAALKRITGAPVYQPAREKALIERLTKDVDPEVREDYEALIREILRLSRGRQERELAEK